MAEEHGHEGSGGFLHKKLFGLPAPVVLGAGALLVWFVLAHRAAAGGVAQAPTGQEGLSGGMGGGGGDTAASLQDQQQAEQLGYQTALDKLNLEAARFGLTQQEAAYQQQALALGGGTPVGKEGGHTAYSYGSGPISKAWQQIQVGGQMLWEDRFHPGHIIDEGQAQQLAPQDKGPYASGANKITLGNIFAPILGAVIPAFQRVATGWIGAQTGLPVGLPNQPAPVAARPAPQSAPATPTYTPPFMVASNTRLLG